MKKFSIPGIAIITILAIGCKNNTTAPQLTITPEMGKTYNAGQPVSIQVHYSSDIKPDSIVYQLDSVRFASGKDSAAITLKTDTLHMGSRLVTAKVYQGGKSQEVATNFMLYAAKPPEELNFVVEKVFPHDTSSYTEGLLYQDGYLYESDGGRVAEGTGRSSLRKVDVQTGKVVKMTELDDTVFAEGISIIGDKIIQMTYTEKIGYVYDKNTFKLLNTFTNNVGVEGWGMCYDGKQLYLDDSSNRIWFLNKDTYHAQGYIDVCDDKGPMSDASMRSINELEMIDNKLYANIYQTDTIIVINPKTGAVVQRADMSTLWPRKDRPAYANEFNGIAWDDKGKRLFVTGKNWPHLYQIKLVKKD